MSISALELLKATGLLNEHFQVADLSGYSPSNLHKVLEYYRNHRLRSAEADAQSARCAGGEFSALVSSFSARNAVLLCCRPA